MTSVSTDRRLGVNSGAALKVPCRAASTGNLTLSGEQTIDGVACVTGDRVLVKNQTSGAQNGIYIVDTGTWGRAPDWDGAYDVVTGTAVYITSGSSNSGTYWAVTTTGTITIGTTSVAFTNAVISSAASISTVQSGIAAANQASRTSQAKMAETWISVKDAKNTGGNQVAGDNSQDDSTGIQAAIDGLSSGGTLFIPRGTYKTTVALSVTKAIQIIGEGAASIIRGTNAAGAHTLHVDGTGVSNGMQGLCLRNFVVTSEAGGGDALKLTNCASGIVDNVMVPSAAGAGIRSVGSFYMTYIAPKASTNLPYTAGTRAVPIYGLSLEDNGVTGIASGHNTVLTPDFAGITTSTGCGINIDGGAAHNMFYGGKSAGNKLGVVIGASCQKNKLDGTVVESNTTRDIDISGQMNGLIGVQSLSDSPQGVTTFYSGAKGNYIIGGEYRLITVNAGAKGTIIVVPASLSAGITDNGTGTQIIGLWDITNEVHLPEIRILPTKASSDLNGMVAWKDSADANRVWAQGIDNSLGTNGVGWLQVVRNGSNYLPWQLNPNGGTAELGGGLVEKRNAPTYGNPVTINCAIGNFFEIIVTNNSNFTISDPTVTDARQLRYEGQRITIKIKNTSGGAMGAITWGAGSYKMSAWTNPASANSRSITFICDNNGIFCEVSRTPSDVPN